MLAFPLQKDPSMLHRLDNRDFFYRQMHGVSGMKRVKKRKKIVGEQRQVLRFLWIFTKIEIKDKS